MSEKKFTGKEFYGKENPIREAFKPILPFVVPHMVFPMENFAERIEELQQILSERLELQSLTDENVPTDFYNQDNDYVDWKNHLFNEFFAREIELISKAWFDWNIDVKEYSEGKVNDHPTSSPEADNSLYQEKVHGMTVTSAWVEQAQTFHQHLPHDHGVENFSCVLFAGFDNKVHESTCLVSPYRSADGMIYQYNPHVNEGDILVIPGNLLHYTTQNRSTKPRTVIVFNLQFKSYLLESANLVREDLMKMFGEPGVGNTALYNSRDWFKDE